MSAKTLLDKKLAAYAIAGSAALALPGVAKADLIYSGPINQTVAGVGSYDLTRPGQSTPDFTLVGDPTPEVLLTPAAVNSVAGVGAPTPTAFNWGDVIDGSVGWFSAGTSGTLSEYKYVPPYLDGVFGWPNGVDQFAGLQFNLADGAHYGWARVNLNVTNSIDTTSFTVKDWAYQSDPDVSITAGEGAVPEPSSLALFALGALGLAALRRSRKNRA